METVHVNAGDALFPCIYEREPEVFKGATRRFGVWVPAIPVIRSFQGHEYISTLRPKEIKKPGQTVGEMYLRPRSRSRIPVSVRDINGTEDDGLDWLFTRISRLEASNCSKDSIFTDVDLAVSYIPDTVETPRGLFLIPVLKEVTIIR